MVAAERPWPTARGWARPRDGGASHRLPTMQEPSTAQLLLQQFLLQRRPPARLYGEDGALL